MNRLGWGILAGLVIIALAFVAMLGAPFPRRTVVLMEPAAQATGSGLVVPVVGVAPTALVDSFNDARGGGGRIHGAIDIPAPRGAAVIAAEAGRIEKLFESHLGGHTIYQRSRDGSTIYYYAHLDGYLPGIVEGRVVRRGQIIGFVGSSGDANPAAPHLHFEVHRMAPGEHWWQGTAVNPYPLLAGQTAAR